MNTQFLHIVSFDIPYPADYGGIIDVFYKIKAFHESGIKTILHCFQYNKTEQPDLEKYCEKIYYYPRPLKFMDFLSFTPFIVKSRKVKTLLNNLSQDNYPILFEGLHTTAYLTHPVLSNRKKYVRTHNIEHDYYRGLSRASNHLLKKIYFYTEALKLKHWESILINAHHLFSITPIDNKYFEKINTNTSYIPVFYNQENYTILFSQVNLDLPSQYILFQGNLSVDENIKAIQYLINEVFSKINYPVIIAGKNPDNLVKQLCSEYKNILLIENPSIEVMDYLIQNAQINCLYSFQNTGFKLKLINALAQGKFVIANNNIIQGLNIPNRLFEFNSTAEALALIENLFYGSNDECINNLDFLNHDLFKKNNLKIKEIIHIISQ